MKIRLFSLVALAGLLAGSCAVEEVPSAEGSIIAVMENDDTRTTVTDQGRFAWSEGDQVWLQTTDGTVTGTLSSGAGTSSAEFTYGDYIGELTGNAAYPYNSGHSVSGDELSFVLPASYDLGSNLSNTNAAMYGEIVGGTIRFNHLAGVMRFVLKNVPAGANRFQITLDKKINGAFTADLTADYPIIEASATTTASEKTVTLHFDALSGTSDISLYIPLPVGTYTTLALGLYDDDEALWTYSNIVTNTISRKTLKLMPSVTLGGSGGGENEGGESDKEPLQLTYEVTSAGVLVSLIYDAENYPVAGVDNALNYIDYGDGTKGTEYSHSYAEPGVYNVKMFFENDVTQIGERAFNYCSELVGIQLPESLLKIGRSAFGSSGLKGELIIPANNVYVGVSAFAYTGKYENFIIPFGTDFSDGPGQFFGIKAKNLYLGANIPDDINMWYDGCIFEGSQIEKLIIGNQVSTLGTYALGSTNPKYISSIEFEEPAVLSYLGDAAFLNNAELKSITIPDGIEFISTYGVFDLCPKLESINISSKNSDYWSYDGVLYSNCVEGTANSIFRYPEAKKGEVFENKSIMHIVPSAFRDNQYLKKVSVNLTLGIGDRAFMGCTNLTEIEGCDYPYGDAYAYEIYIGEFAFRDCTSLTEFTIGSGVDIIREGAFNGCTSLERIYCMSPTPPVLSDVNEYLPIFGNNAPGRLICVPMESLDLYKEAQGWDAYKDAIVGYKCDYIDEYGINHGQGVEIGETVWAPVNCGYHKDDYQYGKLYQWGRKYGQGSDGDATVPTLSEGGVSELDGNHKSNANVFYYGFSDWVDPGNDELWNSGTEENPVKTEYDPCPDGWRVPTSAELNELCSNRSSWTTDENGQIGYWFSGASSYTENVPQVFFPAAGFRSNDGNAGNRDFYGNYCSSRPYSYYDGTRYACYLYFGNGFANMLDTGYRALGYSVRCVQVTD